MENAITKVDLRYGIQFNKVNFRYPTAAEKTKDVFDEIDLTIKAGTSTAIVGASGSGKSTIV
jgi:ABC-type bacteriocin/lantibiotic exporter with double-glycine peptidase domain